MTTTQNKTTKAEELASDGFVAGFICANGDAEEAKDQARQYIALLADADVIGMPAPAVPDWFTGAVGSICLQSGEDPAQLMEWMKNGGLVEMVISHFAPSGKAPAVPDDISSILLRVEPGDGDGVEVYATSVSDVQDALTELSCKLEDAELEIMRLLDRMAPAVPVVDAMVGAFLSWRLPDDFGPDAGISFDPIFNKGTQWEMRHEPSGTNLLNYDQAKAMVLHMLAAVPQPPAVSTAFDFVAHLARQREFSERTFGPGKRVMGVTDHIAKELIEVRESDGDLKEWVDVIILGLDGAWRSGASPEQIIQAIVAKQVKNEGRIWPDWRTAPEGSAIEHVRNNASCTTCNGIGMIGGFVNAESGFESEDCPECGTKQPPAVSDDKRDAMPIIVHLGEGKTGVTAFKHADGEIGVALNQLREGYKYGQEVGQADTVDDLNANVLLVTHNPVGFDVLINALKEAQSFLNDEPGAPDPRDQQIAELRRQVFSYESMVAYWDELMTQCVDVSNILVLCGEIECRENQTLPDKLRALIRSLIQHRGDAERYQWILENPVDAIDVIGRHHQQDPTGKRDTDMTIDAIREGDAK